MCVVWIRYGRGRGWLGAIEEKKKIMKELRKNVKERDGENYALNGELEELNVSVNERRHIHEVNGKREGSGIGVFWVWRF